MQVITIKDDDHEFLKKCQPGIDTRTIKNHIDKGYLKARKRKSGKTERQGGEAYYILPQNIRKWIIEHVGKISLKHANKYVLVDLLTTVKDY